MCREDVVEYVGQHPSRLAIVESLRTAVEQTSLTFLIGPFKTGKTSITRQVFPNALRLDPFAEDDLERLTRMAEGKEYSPEIVIVDEAYPDGFEPELLMELSQRTRVIGIAHPSVLDTTSEKHDLFFKGLSNYTVVKNYFWSDELMYNVCTEVLGFSDDEARDIVVLSGGLPHLIEGIRDYGTGRREFYLSNMMDYVWVPHLRGFSDGMIEVLDEVVTGNPVPDSSSKSVLQEFEYIENNQFRAKTFLAYFKRETNREWHEELKYAVKCFQLR